VAAAVLGLALAGCILLPLGSRDAVPTPRQRIVVAHDAGDFRVDPDGGLSVRETLDVEVVGTRERSLSLSIDRQDASDDRVRRDVTDLRVTRDGHAVTSFTRTTSAGRFTTVRIGTLASPRLSLGVHSYVVSYRMARVLEAGTAYPTRFDWAVVPATFGVPVEQADLTVHLPAPAAAATCTAQVPTGCALNGRHTRDLTAHVEGLPRLTAVRLDVGLSMAPPPGPARLPWSTHWAQVLGPSVRGVLVVVSLGLAAVLVGLFLARGAFEHRPRRREAPELPTEDLPRADVPPDGIGPTLEPGENGFDGFARYGFRVPFTVVSPWARKNYVSHRVFDHTSILKLVETKWNLPALTYRDANATAMLDLLDLDHPAFATPPKLAEPLATADPSALSCSVSGPGTIPPPASVTG